ncbi:MAG: DNA primase, partial [Anaerolineaceae bacterium]|nr:DNA primase [Anaerolineaceae bacterium]
MSVVDEIKARLDLVTYISESVQLRQSGRRYKANCPFHVERTPSFIVDPERGSWRCFGACAEGGDIFTFAMKRHGWSFREALEELARRAGVELRPRTPEQTEREQEREALLGLLAAMTEQYQDWLQQPRDEAAAEALRYAREERQLSEETLTQFQIGYAPAGWQHSWEALRQLGYAEEQAIAAGVCGRSETSGHIYDRFRARLIFPIFDARGRVRGFGGRALDDGADEGRPQAKYLNSPQSELFDKSRLLYGLDRARAAIRETGVAVVVEGYLDVIQAHQAGYRNVVAQMGTALTEPQLRLLLPGARVAEERRIVLALDA